MRINILVLALILSWGFESCGRVEPSASRLTSESQSAPAATSSTATTKVDFEKQIKPILQARCQPCHFQGGIVYDRMPFDRAQTIKTLGTKLFTRIKDEDERRVIREFLSQP